MRLPTLLTLSITTTAALAFEIPFKLPFNLFQGPFTFKSSSPELFELHKNLIEIPSVTGSEHNVGVFLEKYLLERNYTVERIPIEEGSSRENVYAYIGKDRNPR
jgi:acetylornithine deacetylase